MKRFKLKIFLGTFLVAGSGCAAAKDAQPTDAAFCRSALDAAQVQMEGFLQAYPDPTLIARSYEHGETKIVDPKNWTSGFVAGSFWYLYEHSKEQDWLQAASKWTAALESQKHNTGTHDVGFMMYNSFGNGYRLTDDETYPPVLLQSADSLMTRYSAVVGATRSWDWGKWSYPVIIDNMMNLELLYFASQHSGDRRYADAATTHATTTINNHFRPDFSSYHVVDFDPETGKVVAKKTHQGIRDDSAWARGQAWGLYGFTMVYRNTRDDKFLAQANHIADFYLGHPDLPEDKVPYFDFDAVDDEIIVNHRDSSAAAVTASALLELAGFVDTVRAKRYRDAAMVMLRSLASPEYSAAPGTNGHFLLKHATGRWQADDEVDAAINYADYYYLEALTRCSNDG